MSSRLLALLVGLGSVWGSVGFAQCQRPLPGFGLSGLGGYDSESDAVASFDDGTGSKLYVGGGLQIAGELPVGPLARWDGMQWSAVPGGPGPSCALCFPVVHSLAVLDDGTGPALYVGGNFTDVNGMPSAFAARWRASGWEAMPGFDPTAPDDGYVQCFAAFDSGNGPEVYAGGHFFKVGGQSCFGIAKWSGTTWLPVGSNGTGGDVYAFEVYDDGSGHGTSLFMGGAFATQWGDVANWIARWDGTTFSSLGSGMDGHVKALRAFDDGSGLQLYAGGLFSHAGGLFVGKIARWNGTQWSLCESVQDMQPISFETFDDGNGEALYVGCRANQSNVPTGANFMRWTGNGWATVGGDTERYGYVFDMTVYDDGGGDALYVTGRFDLVGDVHADHIAKWDGTQFSALGPDTGKAGPIDAMTVHDDGSGPALYTDDGHEHEIDDGWEAVERWTGSSWTSVGPRSDGAINALASFDGAGASELYAAGTFTTFGATSATGVARYSNGAWHDVVGGLGGGFARGLSLDVLDWGSGPKVVVGGLFTSAGGVPANRIAAWDGATWSAFGAGFDQAVRACEVFDEGSGPHLYAGGTFLMSGTTSVSRIARWNGASWEALGSGANGVVRDLQVFDDGGGPQLYVAGDFLSCGGLITHGIARWNGSAWSAVGPIGTNGDIDTLEVFDDGLGPRLYAGGDFTLLSGQSLNRVARFSAGSWSALPGGGADRDVARLLATELEPGRRSLWIGGSFDYLGSTLSERVGEYAPWCPCPPATYCTAKTNSLGCVPAIRSSGSTSLAASDLHVEVTNVLNNKSGILFWGDGPKHAPFQGGTLCVQPPFTRTPLQDSAGNPFPEDCSGQYSFHFSASYAASHFLAAGDSVYCQYWSRDPASASTTGLTDALFVLLCP